MVRAIVSPIGPVRNKRPWVSRLSIETELRFTPYLFGDVGALVKKSYPELYLFSSDYPHAEGGRDPIGCFDLPTPMMSSRIR